MSKTGRIDLAFRPRGYFWPLDFGTHLVGRIKGVARRQALRNWLAQGGEGPLPEMLDRATLTEAERTEGGRIHPSLMGGEYLPDTEADEIEIARVTLASTMSDVIGIYARRLPEGIGYRVVDEYGGGTLEGPSTRESAEPLTLGELVDFLFGAWPYLESLSDLFEDLSEARTFVRGESEFYPAFDAALCARVRATVREMLEGRRAAKRKEV